MTTILLFPQCNRGGIAANPCLYEFLISWSGPTKLTSVSTARFLTFKFHRLNGFPNATGDFSARAGVSRSIPKTSNNHVPPPRASVISPQPLFFLPGLVTPKLDSVSNFPVCHINPFHSAASHFASSVPLTLPPIAGPVLSHGLGRIFQFPSTNHPYFMFLKLLPLRVVSPNTKTSLQSCNAPT